MKLKIKKNDRVMVIAGKDKGKIGKILKIYPEKERAVVEKINLIKRHTRPNQKGQGGIVEKEAPLHISNLMIMCAKCNKAVRIGVKELEDGRRVRICKKCGQELEA
ncbi:MAG: 50S ribosomal protein L24 [Thermodesulfobacteriota bacterium]